MWERDPRDDEIRDMLLKGLVQKGGPGSGHRGHKGRPGVRGGSAPRGAGAAPKKPGAEAKPGEEGAPPLQAEIPEWLATGEVTDIKQNPGGVNGEATFRGKIGENNVFLKSYNGLNPHPMRRNIGPKLDLEHEEAAQIINNALGKPTNFPTGLVRETALGRTWVQMFAGQNDVMGGGKRFGNFPDDQKNGMGLLDAVIGNLDRHEKNMRFEGQTLFAIDHGLAFPTKNEEQGANHIAASNRPARLAADESRRLDDLVIRRGEIDGAVGKWLKPAAIHAMWQRVDYMRRNKEVVIPGQWTPPKRTTVEERPVPKTTAVPAFQPIKPAARTRYPNLFKSADDIAVGRMLTNGIFKGSDDPPSYPTLRPLHVNLRAPVLKGGEGSGFHGHVGRPGEVGGSAPSGAAATKPSGFTSDREKVIEQATTVAGMSKKEATAIADGFDRFRKQIESKSDIVGWIAKEPIAWKMDMVGGDTMRLRGYAGNGQEIANMRLTMATDKSGARVLDAGFAAVTVHSSLMKSGLGGLSTDNMKQIARDAGAKSVIMDAYTDASAGFGGDLHGAYIWAKQGVRFADDRERQRTLTNYGKYLRDWGVEPGAIAGFKEPSDIVNHTINTQGSKNFKVGAQWLYHEQVRYQGRLGVQ